MMKNCSFSLYSTISINIVPGEEFHSLETEIYWPMQFSHHSMELLVAAKLAHSKFHGIPWNCSCHRNWRTPSSLEFHGIPWNCSCQRNWRTPSSIKFHGIPWNCSCQRNWRTLSFMEFHGTARVIEIGPLWVPWNSMELLQSAKLAHSKFQNLF